jgi:hypothetical protein
VRSKFHLSLAVLLACLPLLASAAAGAAETSTIQANFTPDEAGTPTNLSVLVKFSSSTQPLPPPITSFTAYTPAGVSDDLAGTSTCTLTNLQHFGTSACPATSRAGFGGGMSVSQLGTELIREPFTMDVFLAPRESGRLAFVVYLRGLVPTTFELTLKATQVAAPKPYGMAFTMQVPPIVTIPGASDASLESIFLTFGSAHVAYYKTVHGKRTLVHIAGLIAPRHCPTGGFPLAGLIDTLEGTSFTSKTTIPCPHGSSRR